MKSNIGRYREVVTRAAQYEREGELAHATKLWRVAEENARDRHDASQMAYCQRRAAFCERALWRARQAGGRS